MSYDLLRGGEILGEAAVEGRDVGRVLGRSPSGCGEVTSSPTPLLGFSARAIGSCAEPLPL